MKTARRPAHFLRWLSLGSVAAIVAALAVPLPDQDGSWWSAFPVAQAGFARHVAG